MRKTIILLVVLFLFAFPVKADEPSEEEKTIDAIESATESTVIIRPYAMTTGTGFYISENTILTAWHVVRGKETVNLTHGETVCTGKVGHRDTTHDLAAITTDCKGTPLRLAGDVHIGQTVVSVGHPGTSEYVSTKGIISGFEWGQVMADVRIRQGMSGGALVNLDGEVVGVMTGYLVMDSAMAYGTDLKNVKRFIERIGE